MGQLQVQQRASLWLFRFSDQRHVGLLRGAPALADVALHAGAHNVFPGADAALAARQNVVQAQLARRELLAALLTLIVVAGKNVPTIELHRLLGQLVVVQEADHARNLDPARGCRDPVVVFLHEVPMAEFADFAP